MSSTAQVAANRANAQLSSGPSSPAGKAKASLNAVKTGLTGRTVLLPSEDAAAYETLIRGYEAELQPIGQRERDLVQSIADSVWRLSRIPALELAFYAKGRLDCADAFSEYDPQSRASMIDLQTLLTYEKQLRNLQLQEARLHRRKEKDLAELRQLQQERRQEAERQRLEVLDEAARQFVLARHDKTPYDPQANGFEFSIDEVEDHVGKKSSLWAARAISARDRAQSKAA